MTATIKVELMPAGSGRTAVMLNGEEIAVGRGSVVCQAARALIERGHDPDSRLEAWRGSTFCLGGKLGTFATVIAREDAACFVRWTAPPPLQGDAPVRAIEEARP